MQLIKLVLCGRLETISVEQLVKLLKIVLEYLKDMGMSSETVNVHTSVYKEEKKGNRLAAKSRPPNSTGNQGKRLL